MASKLQHLGGGGEGEGGLGLREIAELVRRRRLLVASATVLGAALAFLWLLLQPPVWRASATLLLEQDRGSGGVLGELALLSSGPVAASELEILGSRTIAEQVVRPAFENTPVAWTAVLGAGAEAGGRDPALNLGLTTIVEDVSLDPLAGLLGGGAPAPAVRPRLYAAVELLAGAGEGADAAHPMDPRGGDGALVLRLHFLSENLVRVTPGGPLASWLGGDAVELPWRPGLPLVHGGLRIHLRVEGDPTGHTWRVRRLSRADAVARVLENTRVRETTRNSGVIELTFDDSDPERAAATANALCAGYLRHNRERGQRRASQTVEFIDAQLDRQLDLLNRAELDVVAFQAEHPASIDVGQTAGALIERLSGLEVQRVQNKLLRVGLREALEHLRAAKAGEAGRLEALSRLGVELADPISASYVQQIALLSAESELLERSDAGAWKSLVQSKLLELEAASGELDVELAGLRAALARLETGAPEAFAALAADADPLATGYLEERAGLQARLASLRSQLTADHPEVVAARTALEDVEARILALARTRLEALELRRGEQEQLAAGYRDRLERLPARERAHIDEALAHLTERTAVHLTSRLGALDQSGAALEREIDSIEEQLGALPGVERRLADPLRRLEAHSGIVKFLLGRQQEAEITRASTVAAADFIDRAVPPRDRHGPPVGLALAAGLALGFALGLGLAFAREATDRGVFTVSELERATDLAVFGQVPDFSRGRYKVKGDRDAFLAMRDDPAGPVAEAYRGLRSNLQFALGEDVRTLAFTSSVQGEGKSVTNVDLALAFAMGGRRVLLVDADMRRPRVHEHMEVELEPGLAEVLGEGLDWRATVRGSVHPGLDVIPAGREPQRPGDLLGGDAAAALVVELREAYDLVVFDVPPVLSVADTGTFAARLDAVLLVARSRKLSARVLETCAGRLRQSGANLVGAVLNAALPQRDEQKYGYGYGYGYGERKAA